MFEMLAPAGVDLVQLDQETLANQLSPSLIH
jgi:hypothetical protein